MTIENFYTTIRKNYQTYILHDKTTGRHFVLDGWNGERYYDCFECDNLGYALDPKAPYQTITPIYKQVNDDDFEIIGYEVY